MAYAVALRRLAAPVLLLLLVAWMLWPRPSDVAAAALVEQPAECPVTAPRSDEKTHVTMAELGALTRAAGFGEFGEQVLQTAVATFWHESAHGDIKVRNASGSGAAGLTQIMPANVEALGGDPDVPEDNLRMAKALADERVAAGRDPLGPWVSYTSGAYEQFMDEAREALAANPARAGPPSKVAAKPCGGVPAVIEALGPIDGSNGQLEPSTLCRVAAAPMASTEALLQCPAAKALDALAAQYAADMGKPLCFGNGYRTLAQQVILEDTKPGLAAKAGTSNHGWGLAVDLCGGIQSFGTPQHRWMEQNAGAFGFILPSWAQRGGSRPEPWHFEFIGSTVR